MADNDKVNVTVKPKSVIHVRLKDNSQINADAPIGTVATLDEAQLLQLIDERVKALSPEPESPKTDQPHSEIGVVPWEVFNFAGGYPFSPAEIPFKTPFLSDNVMVRITPTFSSMTNTPYLFNVYDVTATGFKLRMNVKNTENKGLLKALYYEAIYMDTENN